MAQLCHMIDKQAPRLAYRKDEIVADGNVATRPDPSKRVEDLDDVGPL
jgi:hypothetical protein